MNDLVYVMYNLKLKSKQNRKNIPLPFDEIEFDDEWITEEGYNDEDEQPQGEGDGGNVELVGDVGGSSNDLVVDAFDLDNLILVKMMMHNLRKTLMMMEMGMKVMIFMEMILLEDWT